MPPQHELPDDPRSWPADPFALLGVQRGVGEVEVKRAYLRLVRSYKPEHAPEEFRRIREAYDSCLQQLHWFFVEQPEPNPPDHIVEEKPAAPGLQLADEIVEMPIAPDATIDEVIQPSQERYVSRPEYLFEQDEPITECGSVSYQDEFVYHPTPPKVNELDRLWELACDGRESEAYAGLLELIHANFEDPAVPLRLYWLLGMNPLLDPERAPRTWLADAMIRSQLRAPIAELYRRELEANPSAALVGGFVDILKANADTGDLLTVARWRLAAAVRIERWDRMEHDLHLLRDHLTGNDAIWLGLMASTLNCVVWRLSSSTRRLPSDSFFSAHTGSLHDFCRNELRHMSHLQLSHSFYFDRMEEVGRLAKAWQSTQMRFPQEVLHLIRMEGSDFTEVQPTEILAAAGVINRDRQRFLTLLNNGNGVDYSILLSLLTQTFDRYRQQESGEQEEFPPPLIRGLARQLVGGREHINYRTFRMKVLDFLVEETIDPREFASACALDPLPTIREFAGDVGADQGLRVVWMAAVMLQ